MIFSSTLLGTLSHYVYVNISGTDHIDCGSRSQPCRSLFYTINNISRPNDTICLIASPIKEIRYSLEKQIIIKHSLTVTKYPLVGLNPTIIYRVNATSSWNGFYAFASFRPAAAAAAEMLSLKMKSVNFNVNIFSSFSEGYGSTGKNMFGNISGCPLLLSISNSIIRSPSHAVNLSDLSGYENVSIHVEDSIIQNGRFVFQNKRESCEPTEHVKNIIEMNNVTVLNSGIVALSAQGCFNMSFNKLTCYQLTWKKIELFQFRGATLKMQNILIENILPDNNKIVGKALFLIERCVVEIQNVRVKDCKVPSSMWLHKTSALFLLQNSSVKLRNMKAIGNSFQNLARIESSFLFINNISLSNNIFNGTLCSVEKSNLKLNDAEFHNNSVGSLIHISLNSNVFITNNILSRNTIHKNGYSLAESIIQLKNVALTRNNVMKNMLYLTSKSSAIIHNNTLTENNVSEAIYNLQSMSRIQKYNVTLTQNILLQDLLFMRSNCSAIIENNILTENNVSRIAYFLSSASSIQLNNVTFTRNNLMTALLYMQSNSRAVIENNILTENNVSRIVYFLSSTSSIQLNNVTFTGNNLMQNLLGMQSNSRAVIENNILTENNVSRGAYFLSSTSSIQLNNVTFTRNNLMQVLLEMQSNSRAVIENNILTENNVSKAVYILFSISSIQLNNVTFTRNNLMQVLLYMESNSSAVIENNILTENNVSRGAYFLSSTSSIQLNNVTFTRNNLMQVLLEMQSNSRAVIENNILTENNVSKAVYILFSISSIQLNNVTFTRNNLMQDLLYMESNSSAVIENNILTENNVSKTVYLLFSTSSIQLNNVTFTGNNLMQNLLGMQSNSRAVIENNILTENNVSRGAYFLSSTSSIQLNNVTFTRNNLMQVLLEMQSNSRAVIENNILTENNVSKAVYILFSISSIQLNNVTFTRNNLMQVLLEMQSNSRAVIENNILTENNVSKTVYLLFSTSSIQLNNVTFTRNNLMHVLLEMQSNSRAVIENNILTENNVSRVVYVLFNTSSIQLNNVTFTRNNLMQDLLYMESNSSAIIKNNTIVGNNVLGGVLSQSSNLGMDTILLQNNTFADHFILAFFSNNVSLDLMRIKENEFRSGIIQTKNCVGRLANTYIENDDHLSVPAISVTWTYQHHKFFELTNNTITWSYGSSLSFRPIIELTGRINISNVNVLVSSIAEIEVLQYSTKFMPIQSPYFQPFFNTYEILSLFISCRRANVKYFAKYDTVRCTPCVQDKYTLHNGSLNMSSKSLGNKKYKLLNKSTHFTCDDCPAGANCTEHIKSKSNFYGYITQQQKVKFVSCPLNFCCSADQCKTITSCNKWRSGTLCGKCSKNNTESFLSTNCISVNLCKNSGKFWLIYCAYALILASCLYYMKDLIVLIKTAGGKVSKVFKFFRKEKKIEGETDEMISIIGNEEHPEEKISHFTMSGIFALIVSFYQIKEVMAVDVKHKNASLWSFITFISKFINLEIVAIKSSSYCPMNDLNAVSKAFIKTYLLTVALIMASLMNYFVSRLYYSFGGKLGRRSSLKPSDRLGVCLVRVLMLNYKNMATASLILLNCVEVAGIRVLYVNGDIKCFEWWQVMVAVFFCTWIMFFPLSLKLSYTMFMKDEITFPKFIFSLMVPFALVVYHILNRNVVFAVLQKPRNVSKVQRILQEMFEESYRLKRNDSRRESIFYETWRLYQRVLLAFAATHFINPLVRITFITPIIILIAISYFAYRPYKPEMYILHWMEIVSILGFFVCLAHNMFRGFLYVYDIKHEYHITLIWEAFKIADLLFSPIWVLLWFFILKPVYSKVKNVIKKRM